MNAQCKTAFDAALLPIIALIILEIAWYVLELIPGLSILAGSHLYLVKFALFAWAGYRGAVASGLDVKIAVIAGALAGIATNIADFILSLVLYPGSWNFSYWIQDFIQWTAIAAIIGFLGYLYASHKAGKNNDSQASSEVPDETGEGD